MSTRAVRILSYFSLPTDLAGLVRDWAEFQQGEGYDFELASASERVSVRRVEPDDDEDFSYVSVVGHGDGPLFERSLGVVIYALSHHSDNLMVTLVS